MGTEENTTQTGMMAVLNSQKVKNIQDGIPTAEKRTEWIDKSIDLLRTHRGELTDAMNADFGCRSRDQSDLTDIGSSIDTLQFAKKHLAKWMRPEKRKVEFPMGLFGARAAVHYQPKGVVGLISPWNFPVNLTFAPLAGIFAAGNRAMIKPSEFTPQTSQVMSDLFARYYSEDEVSVFTGGPEIGAAFSGLPFDHLVFTGATAIAHHVMSAAAKNLVPLTLELGGKSPVLVGPSADMDKAAARIMAGKTLNAGQICLAPDYVFVPEEKVTDFVQAAQQAVAALYPGGLERNDDYTSVVNQRHYDRLQAYLDEARSAGAEVIEINPASEDFSAQAHHKMAPHLVINPADETCIMQEEIFGPILPIRAYSKMADAIAYINDRARPLGLYYFGEDANEQEQVLNSTVSGGVTINDVIFHASQEDMPFGGVGPSGMGAYHGHDGFLEFSHTRAVYKQVKSELLAVIRPPYGEKYRKLINKRIAG